MTTTAVTELRAPDRSAAEQDTTTTAQVGTAAATAAAAQRADLPMELVWVDPGTLILGPNVRADVRLDKGFVGSIKKRGVKQPITAVRTDDGDLRVLFGSRRTLGAIEAELPVVPVIVVTEPDDEKAAKVARIVDQLGENEHRASLAASEVVTAHQELLDLGLSAAAIARQTSTSPKRVKQTTSVARSELAKQAMDRFELDLEQAAAVAEFDGDAEAVKALTVAAKKAPEQFDHVLQRLRDARAEAAELAAATKQLTDAGVRVIDQPDSLMYGPVRRLTDLRATPGIARGTQLAVQEHADCPGHAAYLHHRQYQAQEGERFTPIWVCTDWRTHGHWEINAADPAVLEAATKKLTDAGVTVVDEPDTLVGGPVRKLSELRATAETLRGQELTAEEHTGCPGHAAYLQDRSHWHRPGSEDAGDAVVPVWVCTDWRAHGHAERFPSTGAQSGPMTDEQKAERRTVVNNNKAWDSATTVRRRWLRQFLARRTAPKDAQRWIAVTLAGGSHDVRRAMENSHRLAVDLLGMKMAQGWYQGSDTPHPIAAAAAKASPARATLLSLGVLLAGLEAGTSRNTWRSPTRDSRAYFTALQDWGYPLSEVEQLVLGRTAGGEGDECTAEENASEESTDGEDTGDEGADEGADDGEEPDTEVDPAGTSGENGD